MVLNEALTCLTKVERALARGIPSISWSDVGPLVHNARLAGVDIDPKDVVYSDGRMRQVSRDSATAIAAKIRTRLSGLLKVVPDQPLPPVEEVPIPKVAADVTPPLSPAAVAAEESKPEPTPEPATPSPFDLMSREQLRVECMRRKIFHDSKASRSDLVKLLQQFEEPNA